MGAVITQQQLANFSFLSSRVESHSPSGSFYFELLVEPSTNTKFLQHESRPILHSMEISFPTAHNFGCTFLRYESEVHS